MHCKNRGEQLEGDGYLRVFHCPNADYDTTDSTEPDGETVHCSEDIEDGVHS